MIIPSVFSVFEPSVYFIPWFFVFFFFSFWSFGCSYLFFFYFFLRFLGLEFCSILGYSSFSGSFLFFFCLSFFIFVFNFVSLFPFVFTLTGHLFFTLGLSLTVWAGIVSFYLIFNMGGFLSHLVAPESPLVLSPFIVCLELISIFIRPISLSVRLISNIVAGHLLLGLVGLFCLNNIGGSFMGLALSCLELGVCVVQAYVFSVLCLLYSMESHCEQVPSLSSCRA